MTDGKKSRGSIIKHTRIQMILFSDRFARFGLFAEGKDDGFSSRVGVGIHLIHFDWERALLLGPLGL